MTGGLLVIYYWIIKSHIIPNLEMPPLKNTVLGVCLCCLPLESGLGECCFFFKSPRDAWTEVRCSPDLSPLDYFLRGFLKEMVYKNKPRTLNSVRTEMASRYVRLRVNVHREIFAQY